MEDPAFKLRPIIGEIQFTIVIGLRSPFACQPASSTEKAVTPYSSTLAWKIPWTEEPGRLQAMGSLRVGHD